jgi:hypothetical protein
VSDHTSEAKVFYDPAGHRAWKKTWPGTFGFIPRKIGKLWKSSPATPLETLSRLKLHNEIFCDDMRLEGVSVSETPGMVIGQSSSGISLVFCAGVPPAVLRVPRSPRRTSVAAVLANGEPVVRSIGSGGTREPAGGTPAPPAARRFVESPPGAAIR